MDPVILEVLIERNHPGMAAFVVVPASAVAAWSLSATTTVEGTLDGILLGRRSLHRWDADRWFVELRRETLKAAGKVPGDRAALVISIASSDLPAELQALIDGVPEARARWEAHTRAQQRMLREEILAAKSLATRERRARRALLPPERPRPARVAGLGPSPQRIVLRIVGRRLPGTSCGPYRDVRVALALKVGYEPKEGVPADVPEATWETQMEVRERDGVPAFRGPAVNGPPCERFVYLTWTGRKGAGPQEMFRRAKLRLDAIPSEVLAKALESGLLLGDLQLTALDGMPVCASVRPPAIEWSA